MKSFRNWSLGLKWLGVSVVITLVCVFAGGFITKKLVERERDLNMKFRPHGFHYEVMKRLVDENHMSPQDAYKVVEKNPKKRGPFESFLVTKEGKVIDSWPESRETSLDVTSEELLPLGPGVYLLYSAPDEMTFEGPRPHGPPRRGGPRMPPPPPGAGLIGLVAIAVSIVVGLGLSMLFFTVYIRRKSKEAEEIISKLKSGDLKARFKIHQSDESSLLMFKFNEMAEQIEILVENLRSTEKARMVLLQELAHDLRTPVASLKNLQEMLLDKGHLMDEEKRKHVQTLAIKEVQYFERLVEDLLFLSGVNDPRYSSHFRPVDLSHVIREEIEFFETDKLKIRFHPETHLKMSGDEHLLHRLVKNALSNASRFAKSSIEIRLLEEDEHLSLRVIDDGPGMSSEDLQGFGQKKYSRKIESRDNISIGLGSVIMKKIASLHEGDLKVQNHEKGGLELVFTFRK